MIEESAVLDPAPYFRPAGPIAKALGAGADGHGYEERPQQVDMAQAVAHALSSGCHALLEAGTGVGKSFAYLVPLLQWAHQAERTVAVATSTIALQEQLVGKDLPLLAEVLPFELSFALVKGRGNYLCARRMHMALAQAPGWFDDQAVRQEIEAVRAWIENGGDGSRQGLPFVPRPDVWEQVRAESGNCLGRNCPHYSGCSYQRARRRAHTARLLVLNHDILLSDVALRRSGGSFLPELGAIVIDEAHDFEEAAARHLGATVTARGVLVQLGRLWSGRRRRGLLSEGRWVGLRDDVDRARASARSFFDELHRAAASQGSQALPEQVDLRQDVSATLETLARDLVDAAQDESDLNVKMELTARARGLRATGDTLQAIACHADGEQVRWLERGARHTALCQAPLDIGPLLEEALWSRMHSVVLTSATLATGDPPTFEFMRKRLGLEEIVERRVGSPFDYRSQVQLVLRGDLPDPSRDAAGYDEALPAAILRAVRRTEGNAFVLFTSKASLRRAADALRNDLLADGHEVLVQGEELSRSQMLDRFREGGAVLFGVVSFWQGVDVPGDALRHVIVTRLPFEVPTHPLQVARRKRIADQGGDAFRELSLPVAALRLKQGFGRLIRRTTDEGMVTILDPRIVTKSYGAYLRETLPDCGEGEA